MEAPVTNTTQNRRDDPDAIPLSLNAPWENQGLPLHFGAGHDQAPGQSFDDDGSLVIGEPRGRVLIVEDEALVALDMAMILNSAGYQVMGTKPTGDSALIALSAAAADGIAPDLVLMDIALRGAIDGIDTTIQIKSKYPGVPVAFVTGQADPITRARAEATGPAGYLLKPFTPEQLVSFIQGVLASK
jgi:CheY-like chemotaxis protein